MSNSNNETVVSQKLKMMEEQLKEEEDSMKKEIK